MATLSCERLSEIREQEFLRSTSRQAAIIFLAAFCIRLTIALHEHSWLHTMRAEMEREAISMARTGVLGNPFLLPSGPSATVPPLYPLMMAAVFRIFGTGAAGEAIKVLATCLISSVQYALLPWVGKRLQFPPSIGYTAGLVGALIPLNPYIEVQGDFENHLSGVLLLILLAWTVTAASRPLSVSGALAIGGFYGICTLTSPSLAPLCCISLAYVVFEPRTISQRPLLGLLGVASAILVVAPWPARNYVQLRSPILTRSNFGLEFSLANNDRASPLMIENEAIFACCHPLKNAAQARQVQQIGEVEYNRRLKQKAFEWVREHPSRFAQLTALRIWYMWAPKAPEQLRTLAFRSLTLLSLGGIIILWRTNRKTALLCSVPLIVYPLPYYLVQIHFRYRYPMTLIFLLLSCVTAFRLLQWFFNWRKRAIRSPFLTALHFAWARQTARRS